MDPKSYKHKELLPLVNNVDAYARLQEFIAYRIELIRNELENVDGIERLKTLQGQIIELRRFQKLQETARNKAEHKE